MANDPPSPSGPDDNLLGLVLAAIGSVVILLDGQGRVRLWNPVAERLLGIPAAQAVGALLAELPIAWEVESLNALVPGLVPDRPVRLDEVRVHLADGTELVLAFSIQPLTGDGGCLWHGADISERRSMEAQLRQAQKMEAIGSLASGIAHEINTPMQFVGDNSRFLADAFAGMQTVIAALRTAATHAPEEDRAAVTEAEKAADLPYLLDEIPKALGQSLDGINRVARIVKAMKEFAHPGIDEPTPTDLNHAIESTLTVSRNTWKYVAEVELALDPQMPPVQVVPGGFNQVVLNLIVNAAHAIEDQPTRGDGKGVIRIRTAISGENAVVEVSDTGCGIPEAIRKRIFDPFFTTKEPGRGTGQGLALVRSEVVERLGGRIEVDSEPGKGSTFRLLLPMRHATTAIRRKRQAAKEASS